MTPSEGGIRSSEGSMMPLKVRVSTDIGNMELWARG